MAAYDLQGVASLNIVSSNPILLFTCRLHAQRKGGEFTTPPGDRRLQYYTV
jgi:hypothetical protein